MVSALFAETKIKVRAQRIGRRMQNQFAPRETKKLAAVASSELISVNGHPYPAIGVGDSGAANVVNAGRPAAAIYRGQVGGGSVIVSGGGGGGGGSGIYIHNEMSGRDAPNTHPIDSITGLREALDDINIGHDPVSSPGGTITVGSAQEIDVNLAHDFDWTGLHQFDGGIGATNDLMIAPGGAIVTDNIIRSTIFDAATGTAIFMQGGNATFRGQVITPVLKNTSDLHITSDDTDGLIQVDRIIQSTNFDAASGIQIDPNSGTVTVRGRIHTPEVRADSGLLINAGGFITTDNTLRDSAGKSSLDLLSGIGVLAAELRTPKVSNPTVGGTLRLAAGENIELFPIGDVVMNGVQRAEQYPSSGMMIDWPSGTFTLDTLDANVIRGRNDLEIRADVLTLSDHGGGDRVVLDGLGLRSAVFRSSTLDPIGWRLGGEEQEFANIIANGRFRSSVFEIGEVQVTGGRWLITEKGGATLKEPLSIDTSSGQGHVYQMTLHDPTSGHYPHLEIDDLLRIRAMAWEHPLKTTNDSVVPDFLFMPRATEEIVRPSIRDAYFVVTGVTDNGDSFAYDIRLYRPHDEGRWTWNVGTAAVLFGQIQRDDDWITLKRWRVPAMEFVSDGNNSPYIAFYELEGNGCQNLGNEFCAVQPIEMMRSGNLEGLSVGLPGEFGNVMGNYQAGNYTDGYLITSNKRIGIYNMPIVTHDINGNERIRIQPVDGMKLSASLYLKPPVEGEPFEQDSTITWADDYTGTDMLEIGIINFDTGWVNPFNRTDNDNHHLMGTAIVAYDFAPIDGYGYASGTHAAMRLMAGSGPYDGGGASIDLIVDKNRAWHDQPPFDHIMHEVDGSNIYLRADMVHVMQNQNDYGVLAAFRLIANTIKVRNLPTSPDGLVDGDFWMDDQGYVRVV